MHTPFGRVKLPSIFLGFASAIVVLGAGSTRAQYVPVYGGPTYDATVGSGYQGTTEVVANNVGTAVGFANRYVGGAFVDFRAVRWDASGTAPTELDNLGTNNTGSTYSGADAINSAGTTVGRARKFNGNTLLGYRAVRWDEGSTAVTELGHLGTDSSGFTNSLAIAINTVGIAAGVAKKFGSGTDMGDRAVRWEAGSTLAIELGSLGTDASGHTNSSAAAINDAGVAVGNAYKYSGNALLGIRAVRWNAGGTAATELANLGTDSSGETYSYAISVNFDGTVVGNANKYNGSTRLGTRAVRWDVGGTVATELGNLGTDANGATLSSAVFVNAIGTIIGYAQKYAGGTFLGYRAVRWDLGTTDAIELGHLGTNVSGFTTSSVAAINSDGIAVGRAAKYSGNTNLGNRAVLWGPDGIAIDLNTFIDANSGWILTDANGITDTNWIVGVGSYDPDGAGPLVAYSRGFLMQVPEPANLSLFSVVTLILLRRRIKVRRP